MKTTSDVEVSNGAVSCVIPHPSSFHRLLWRLVEVVIGGLFSAAALTLIVLPALYVMVEPHHLPPPAAPSASGDV